MAGKNIPKLVYFPTVLNPVLKNFNLCKFIFQTALQLKSEYEERLHLNFTYNNYASFTYDATWSIALMLNKSIPLLREKNKTLETMNYGDKETAKIMRDILFRTDFWGMSVSILFLVCM